MRRRRRCTSCDKRFTTFERIERSMPMVVKRNGTRVEFNLNKIHDSMRLALRKRPVSAEKFEAALSRVQDNLFNLATKEVSTETIGALVMQELQQLDAVAYIRFASVYQSFEDIEEFLHAIQTMRQTSSSSSS